MTKGKPWTIAEQRQLIKPRNDGQKVAEIAVAMGKSEQAIIKKLQRLGLKVVQLNKSNETTTSEVILPEELFTVEKSLKILAVR